jgi:hypothetical protein
VGRRCALFLRAFGSRRSLSQACLLTRLHARSARVALAAPQVAREQVRLLLHAGEVPPTAAAAVAAPPEADAPLLDAAAAEAAPPAEQAGDAADGGAEAAAGGADAAMEDAAAAATDAAADADAAAAPSAQLPDGYDAIGLRVAVFWPGDGTWCAYLSSLCVL